MGGFGDEDVAGAVEEARVSLPPLVHPCCIVLYPRYRQALSIAAATSRRRPSQNAWHCCQPFSAQPAAPPFLFQLYLSMRTRHENVELTLHLGSLFPRRTVWGVIPMMSQAAFAELPTPSSPTEVPSSLPLLLPL